LIEAQEAHASQLAGRSAEISRAQSTIAQLQRQLAASLTPKTSPGLQPAPATPPSPPPPPPPPQPQPQPEPVVEQRPARRAPVVPSEVSDSEWD
jgi:hypothetical protein